MDKKFFKSVLLIILFSILMIYGLWNFDLIARVLIKVLGISRPIIIGFAIAFILSSPQKKLKSLFDKLFKKAKTDKASKLLSIIMTYVLFLLLIAFVIVFMAPELVNSFKDLSGNLDKYIANIQNLINDIVIKLEDYLPEGFNINDKISSYFEALPKLVSGMLSGIVGFTQSFISSVVDFVLGLVISVYFLAGKERLYGQYKKLCLAFMSKRNASSINEFVDNTVVTFTNFISGQIIEAFILGILCFIGMLIFGFEYAFLISFFIGITNVIPIAGPIIGAVPAVLLLLMISPMKAVWFVVYIICLQQFESNVIYPRVVGNKVGLPALWVLLAVIIGGGLFGVFGMMLAVPTMSIIYDIVRKRVNMKIESKIDSKS